MFLLRLRLHCMSDMRLWSQIMHEQSRTSWLLNELVSWVFCPCPHKLRKTCTMIEKTQCNLGTIQENHGSIAYMFYPEMTQTIAADKLIPLTWLQIFKGRWSCSSCSNNLTGFLLLAIKLLFDSSLIWFQRFIIALKL